MAAARFPSITGSAGSSDLRRWIEATRNSVRGFAFALKSEAAIREEVAALVIGVPLALFVAPNAAWYVAMIGALLLILSVELLNTAIEKLADHVTAERHPNIGRVKDFGSAAVLSAIGLAALVWAVALATRFGLL